MMRTDPRTSTRANAREQSLIRRIAPKLLVSLVLGGLFAWLAERGGVPLWPSRAAFAGVRWELVGLSVLLLFVLTWFRATRWRFLIAPVRRLPLKEIVLV